MGFSIIETDRLLICPYHLACAIPMAADREIREKFFTATTQRARRIQAFLSSRSSRRRGESLLFSRDRAGWDRTGADGNTFSSTFAVFRRQFL